MIKKYLILVDPKDLKQLLTDIWSSRAVPALLEYNQKTYKGKISIRGHQIRKHLKKSFEFNLESNSLGIKTVHLNAEYKDPSMMRNKLSMDFFKKIGVLAPDTEHVKIKINEDDLGVYLQLESFDQHFLMKRNLPFGPIFYATNDDANFSLITPENELKKSFLDGYTKKLGGKQSLKRVESFIQFINTASEEEFENKINDWIDIDNYFLWLAGVVCTQNFDGFIHNYALYLNSKTNTFQISPWDYDGTWGRNLKGKPLNFDYIPITGYNTLTGRLLSYSCFRDQYRKTIENVLTNYFNHEKLKQEVIHLHGHIRPYVLDDPYFNYKETFDEEADFIIKFIQNRHDYLINNLSNLK